MDYNHKVLVEMLSLSLQGKKASYELVSSAEWKSLLSSARKHSILPLIFTTLDPAFIDPKIFVELRSSVYNITAQQIQNLKVFEQVIDAFNSRNIPFVAMKGLILRDLYPFPETRTMCDFDIVVREVNFRDAVNTLKDLGFHVEGHERVVHIQMRYDENLLLELHKNLFDEDRVNLPSDYLEELWRNAVPASVCGRKVLSYSNIDHLLYLLLHMSKHFEEGGFGLRQLCDIVLFVTVNIKAIDWIQFYSKLCNLKISRFSLIVFEICRRLFSMNIPEYLRQYEISCIELIDPFVWDILEGGLFGNDNTTSQTSNKISHIIGYHDYSGNNRFLGMILFLFPTPKRLNEKYAYAKKYPVFLPVAWVHRGFFNFLNKQQREIVKVVLNKETAKESFAIMRNRSELVNWIRDDV
jgi:hypothetical protein